MSGVNKRDYTIDFIKIVATTCILFHHYQQGTGAVFSGINFWGGSFYFGDLVELFFIMSGMFCYYNINKNKFSFDNYIKKKYQRLIPLLAISVIVETIIYIYIRVYVLNGDLGFNLWDVIQNAVGIQYGWTELGASINGPTWYISVLLLCYIIFGVLIILAQRLDITVEKLSFAMIILGITINTYDINFPFINTGAARGYIAFFIGVILKYYMEKSKIKKDKIAIVAFSIIIICLILYKSIPVFIKEDFYYILLFVIYPALILLIQSDIFKKIFSNKYLGVLGAISFNTYIWHEPITAFRWVVINQMGINIDLMKFSTMIWFAITAWIVGCISYVCIEKPIIKRLNLEK